MHQLKAMNRNTGSTCQIISDIKKFSSESLRNEKPESRLQRTCVDAVALLHSFIIEIMYQQRFSLAERAWKGLRLALRGVNGPVARPHAASG